MERTIRSLTRHYPRRDEAVVQVSQVLDRYQGLLNPEQSDFTYDDGRVELLLSLTGVLPIPIQSNLYHCPIVFWLPLDFPSTPPIVFILPSETLAVRKGKNVDAGGRVNVQYLDQWSRKSEGCSLPALIDELIPIFSARYPVTTIAPKPAPARPAPPPVPSSSQPTTTNSPRPTTQPPPPPRPPLPTGSPALQQSTSDVPTPPPRLPLPGQPPVNDRPTSLVYDGPARPSSIGSASGIARMGNGTPPRPPLPPGPRDHQSHTLPPGPPPLYHSATSGPPAPPSVPIPQRAATVAIDSSSSGRTPIPHPPAPTSSIPPSSETYHPARMPFVHPPTTDAPLGPPLHLANPVGLSHPTNPRNSYQTPAPPPLPLPGTFSPPPNPPQPPFEQRGLPSRFPTSQGPPPQPMRPYSPAGSTVRSHSPTPSTTAPPSIAPSSSRDYPPATSRHRGHDSYDSQHASNRPIQPTRPYSPSINDSSAPTSPTTPRPLPPPSDSSFSSPARQPVPPPPRFPPKPPQPPPSTIGAASEYEAEYGSYLPPQVVSSAASVVSDHDRVRGGEADSVVGGPSSSSRGSINGGGTFDRYRTHHDPRLHPSSIDAFEPVAESQVRLQQEYEEQQRIGHQPRGSRGSDYSSTTQTNLGRSHSTTVPYYQSPPPPQPPSSSHLPYQQQPQQQQPYFPPRSQTLPPPVGAATSPNARLSRNVTTSANRQAPTKAKSTIKAVNILDDDDEEETPTSPSSTVDPSITSGVSSRSYQPHASASTLGNNVAPPIPPNPALLALRTRLHSKLSLALTNLDRQIEQDHLGPLALMHSDLSKAVPAIEDEMSRLRAVRDVCMNVRDRYRVVVEEGEKRMMEYERKGDGVDVDEIVCGSTVVYTQLLDLVAEDAALEDTIYALGRGLNSGTAKIDLEQFLKRVRSLAREQFLKRALINKIILGLASRRERQQQIQRERAENGVGGGGNGASRNGSGNGGRGTPLET